MSPVKNILWGWKGRDLCFRRRIMKQVQGEKRKMSANDFIQKDYSDYFKQSIFITLNYTNHFSTYLTDCFRFLSLKLLSNTDTLKHSCFFYWRLWLYFYCWGADRHIYQRTSCDKGNGCIASRCLCLGQKDALEHNSWRSTTRTFKRWGERKQLSTRSLTAWHRLIVSWDVRVLRTS